MKNSYRSDAPYRLTRPLSAQSKAYLERLILECIWMMLELPGKYLYPEDAP
jgi:hypothetical protein